MMSAPFGDGGFIGNSSLDNTPSVDQNGGQPEQGSGYNPAFQTLLNDLPQDLHDKVIPHLKSWEGGITKRFQRVQPYNQFIESGTDPELLQTGLNLVNMLQDNPELLWKALGEHYKFASEVTNQQGQGQNEEPTEQDDPYSQKFAELERSNELLAQHIMQIKKQEEEARADQALHAEFEQAKTKYGEFDEEWVIAKCMSNPKLTIDQAAAMYQEWYRQLANKLGAKPLIVGNGGGSPVENINVRKMSDKDTRNLVAQMLEQANAQNR